MSPESTAIGNIHAGSGLVVIPAAKVVARQNLVSSVLSAFCAWHRKSGQARNPVTADSFPTTRDRRGSDGRTVPQSAAGLRKVAGIRSTGAIRCCNAASDPLLVEPSRSNPDFSADSTGNRECPRRREWLHRVQCREEIRRFGIRFGSTREFATSTRPDRRNATFFVSHE